MHIQVPYILCRSKSRCLVSHCPHCQKLKNPTKSHVVIQIIHLNNNQFVDKMETDMVPATRVVTWVFSSSSSLAKPKSDILGFKPLSSSTLVALMSLCTILSLDSSCRKARPLAIPIQILSLAGQSSFT